MRLQELRRRARSLLVSSGAARPEYSADLILASALGLPRAALLWKDCEVPQDKLARAESMTARRASGAPLSYVLHEAEFYGYRFKVGRGVLIPRPETELLVEEALRLFPRGRAARFADWCTGSGCIAAALLLENPALSALGVDKSRSALKWAAINRKLHGLEERFELLRNAEPSLAPVAEGSLDFIVTNPPYIPRRELDGLMSEVRDYEPRMALDGGEGGTELYAKFFAAFPRMLKPGGLLMAETAGAEQICSLVDMASREFVLVNKISDYNGIIRHVIWRKR